MSPTALISIQSGWDGNGKHCDLGAGHYADVETVITKDIRKWIAEETRKAAATKTYFSTIITLGIAPFHK